MFAGSGGFGRETLRTLAGRQSRDPRVELVGVVTAPPRPAGRRAVLTPTPIDALATELGIEPVLRPARLRTPAALDAVRGLRPDLLVVADYGRIVPPGLLELPFGALNLHPSRLPRHRGASPIPATILEGDADTAVTLIRMDAGVDTGPVVAVSAPVALGPRMTTPVLESQLEAIAAELLVRTLPDWLDGRIEPIPQPHDEATTTRPLRREDGRLDPRVPADRLERQVRALVGWPGTFLETTAGERLGVIEASVGPSGPTDVVGRLVADDRGLALSTADGRLRLEVVQPAGGRAMPIDAYLRGRPGLAGSVVREADATMAGR